MAKDLLNLVQILNLQNVMGKQHQSQIQQHVPLHNISRKLNKEQAPGSKRQVLYLLLQYIRYWDLLSEQCGPGVALPSLSILASTSLESLQIAHGHMLKLVQRSSKKRFSSKYVVTLSESRGEHQRNFTSKSHDRNES